MSNFNYLRDIHGRSHIVLFFFLFCFARTNNKKLPTLHPLTNRSFCKHHADDKIDRQKIDRVTAKNRPTFVRQFLSADNIGRFLSAVCHGLNIVVCEMRLTAQVDV